MGVLEGVYQEALTKKVFQGFKDPKGVIIGYSGLAE